MLFAAWAIWLALQFTAPDALALGAGLLPLLVTAYLLRTPDATRAARERLPRWRLTREGGVYRFEALNAAARNLPSARLDALDAATLTDLVDRPDASPVLIPGESERHPLCLQVLAAETERWEIVATDATAQARQARALAALEANVHEALSCDFHVLYRLDYRRQGYDYISPVAAQVTGIALDELMADGGVRRIHERIPDADLIRLRADVREAVDRAEAGHVDCNLEYRLRDTGGRVRWFRDSLRILLDEDGAMTHITGAILEVTDTRMAGEHLRVTLHSIGDGVISTDAAGRITLINPQAVTLTGWREDEAMGRPLSEVLKLRDAGTGEPVPCPIDRVLDGGRMVRLGEALNLENRAGEHIPVTDSVAPILMTGDRAPLGAVVVLRDERQARQSLQKLHESEARYRTLVESSPVGIFHFDCQQTITFLNNRFAEILHTRPDALIGTSVAALTDQSILPTIQAALRGQPGRYEGAFSTAGDEVLTRLSIRTAPAFGANGEVMGGVAIVEDNTARYEAERKLRESETRYALAMRGTNEGLWDWNPLTKELFLSSRLMALLGEAPNAIRTTSDAWLSRLHPDDRDTYYARMVAHLKGETNHFEFEFRLVADSGDYRWFRSRGVAQRDEHGQAYRMVGSIGDITARKRAQMQLTNELAFSRTLVDSLPVGLCVAQRDGALTMINQFFARLAGVSLRDLRRLSALDLIVAEDRPVIAQRMERAFEEGTAWAETLVINPEGRTIPVHFLARRVTLYDTDQLLCIATDISERRKAEEKMRNINRDLELRVQDRTAQLAAAVKELEAFSYSVSHDLRAPLRAIDGYTRIIRDDYRDAFSADAHTLFERMLAAVARMSELIDDLLELSRVSRRPLRRAPIDLSEIARAVVDDLAQRHPDRQVDVEIAGDLNVVADAKLLKIAVENLLGNAWKFTAKRDHAHIRFDRLNENDEIVFCVQDNGAGFDMRYADKLFGAFQRLHTDRDFEGTGIGLATVARIIQRHGGRVWASGEPEAGACFYFTLGEAGADSTPTRST
ncbi:PAS domain S-box protein [Nitrogeniibacter mangrovi]|uniref:histidine kinase n=1 Tax=Nitrogeniibacter mangrovi TaxID=2016596 RepID=A0A6C1B2V0_9RHOO|nr:PAS domain S-box protein [Nitrogeniibacter mangrovi]QID17956.1 PAS domain S-box protein [Nitrogeniibacter mangrovi]